MCIRDSSSGAFDDAVVSPEASSNAPEEDADGVEEDDDAIEKA